MGVPLGIISSVAGVELQSSEVLSLQQILQDVVFQVKVVAS